MGCIQVKYDSRVVIYERKLFIRLATEETQNHLGLSDELFCLRNNYMASIEHRNNILLKSESRDSSNIKARFQHLSWDKLA